MNVSEEFPLLKLTTLSAVNTGAGNGEKLIEERTFPRSAFIEWTL